MTPGTNTQKKRGKKNAQGETKKTKKNDDDDDLHEAISSHTRNGPTGGRRKRLFRNGRSKCRKAEDVRSYKADVSEKSRDKKESCESFARSLPPPPPFPIVRDRCCNERSTAIREPSRERRMGRGGGGDPRSLARDKIPRKRSW